MKKTTAKSTAKTVASKAKAIVKPVAAKLSSAAKGAVASKKAASVKKVTAPAPAPTPVLAPSPVSKAPKAPAPKVKSSPVITKIVAAIDVGFGNCLTLRGEGAGLNWEAGVALECSGGDRWTITLPETTHPIICKFLINDLTWSAGEDYTILPGSCVVLTPSF